MQAFLLSGQVKAALNQTGSALAAITVLKKVCDHPALLTDKAAKSAVHAGGRYANKPVLNLSGSGKSNDSSSMKDAPVIEIDASSFVDWTESAAADGLLDSLHQKSASSSCKTVRMLAKVMFASVLAETAG